MRIRKFKKTKDNLFHFQFLTADGDIIGGSKKGYKTKAERNEEFQKILDLSSVKKNVLYRSNDDGEHYFEVVNKNDKVIFKSTKTKSENEMKSRASDFTSTVSELLSDRKEAQGDNVYAGKKGVDDYKPLGFYISHSKGVKNGFTKIEEDGQYYFSYSKAGRVILMSQGYTSTAGRDNGISSVEKNMSIPSHYQTQIHENGKSYFNLIAGNNQEIATSVWYESQNDLDDAVQMLSSGASVAGAAKIVSGGGSNKDKKDKDLYAEGSYGKKGITYQIFKSNNDKFYFTFKNKDGKTLLLNSNVTGFESEKEAQSYVDGVIKYGGDKGRYENKTTKNGKFYCYLKNDQGDKIAKSFFYGTKNEMLKGIDLLLGDSTSSGSEKSGSSKATGVAAGAGIVGAGAALGTSKSDTGATSISNNSTQDIETKAKAKEEAKAMADRDAKTKVKDTAADEAKAKKEAADKKADKEAKAKADREKEKSEQEAKAKEEREAARKSEREAKAKAEREAARKSEREAKAKAEREAKRKAERDEAKANAKKEKERKRLAKQEKEKAQREKKAVENSSKKEKAAASSSFASSEKKGNKKDWVKEEEPINYDNNDTGGGGCLGKLLALLMIGLLLGWLYMNYIHDMWNAPDKKEKVEVVEEPVKKETVKEDLKEIPLTKTPAKVDSSAIKAAEAKRLEAERKAEADKKAADEKAKREAEAKRKREAAAKAAASNVAIFTIPNSKPTGISGLGTNPQFGDSRGLTPQQFYDKLNDRYQSSQMDKAYLNYLYKQMGYSGWSDAKASHFTEAKLKRGQEGILGFGSYHGYGHYKLNVSDGDLEAFRVKSASGNDVHFMKRCGNYMYFVD